MYYLGIVQEMGVVGLVLGFETASLLTSLANLYIVYCLQDWQDVADRVIDRIAKESEELSKAAAKKDEWVKSNGAQTT